MGIYFHMAAQSCCWLPSCFLGSFEIQGGSQFNTLVGQQLFKGMFFLRLFTSTDLGRVEKSAQNPATSSELSKQALLT